VCSRAPQSKGVTKPLPTMRGTRRDGGVKLSFLKERHQRHFQLTCTLDVISMQGEDRDAALIVMEPSAAMRDGVHSTSINLGGYQYTRAWSSQRKVSYRCSVYRSTGCRGKVTLWLPRCST
jgi:hypothetical protein